MGAPKRTELNLNDTWKLEDMYPSDEAWEADLAKALLEADELKAYKGTLGDEKKLKALLDCLYDAHKRAEQLYCYARMRRDEDNAVTAYQALTDRAQSLLVKLETESSFISPELLAIPGDYLTDCAKKEAFRDYRVFLSELERGRAHTLSAAEERIVAMTGDMGESAHTIYSLFNDADLKFPTVHTKDGDVEITHANYVHVLMTDRDRDVRRAAFEGMYGTYKQYSASVPAMYASSVKSDIFYAQAARFESALEARLFPDQVPVSVYDNLVSAVRAHLPGLQKFVQKNGELIGVSDMSAIDLYVEPIADFDLALSFDQAFELVADCLRPLGEDYVNTLRRARAERWIDPYENVGKSSGAYSWGSYQSHPYVLMNFKPKLDSALTLAHELGHAMHTFYSAAAQPYPTSDYSLFVAEVASTCNEILVLRALMEKYPQKEAQAFLLYQLLDGFRTTVFRQTMFAEFERGAHEMAERSEALTCDSLNALYRSLHDAYYANLRREELIDYEWMRIPHFYRAFYVYKYATGFSAAMALAGGILREGAPAVERYKRFLSAGSSLSPIEALRVAGVDMEKPEAVEAALSEFEALLTRYLELA